MQLVIVAEDNWILSGMVPHIGAIGPTDLSTAALANCNPTLNTDWLVVHSPYVSLHVSAMKLNFWRLLCLGCLHNIVSLVYLQLVLTLQLPISNVIANITCTTSSFKFTLASIVEVASCQVCTKILPDFHMRPVAIALNYSVKIHGTIYDIRYIYIHI